MASLHPKDGARIVLERQSVDDEVHYRVSVYEPDARKLTGVAVLGDAVAVTWDEETPAAWLETFVGRWLKALPKKHAAAKSWPRKLTRWRAERA
ncbi:MAG: hypothetical protein AB8I08_24230 [Sandaracinaceae bacterium]